VELAWGIDHPREEGLDGEVTRQEVDDATLPVSGAHGGYGDYQCAGGVAMVVSAVWGRGRVLAGWCVLIGGRWRWLGEITERGRFSREGEGSIASGFSCSPRFQAANDKRERFANLWTPEGNVQ
jgi:hypothetical protein